MSKTLPKLLNTGKKESNDETWKTLWHDFTILNKEQAELSDIMTRTLQLASTKLKCLQDLKIVNIMDRCIRLESKTATFCEACSCKHKKPFAALLYLGFDINNVYFMCLRNFERKRHHVGCIENDQKRAGILKCAYYDDTYDAMILSMKSFEDLAELNGYQMETLDFEDIASGDMPVETIHQNYDRAIGNIEWKNNVDRKIVKIVSNGKYCQTYPRGFGTYLIHRNMGDGKTHQNNLLIADLLRHEKQEDGTIRCGMTGITPRVALCLDTIKRQMEVNIVARSYFEFLGKDQQFCELIKELNEYRGLLNIAMHQDEKDEDDDMDDIMDFEVLGDIRSKIEEVEAKIREHKDNLKYRENVIWEQESLYRSTFGCPQVLLIDEWISNINQFDSPTHREHIDQNREIFEELIRNTEVVIFSDANMRPKVMLSLLEWRKGHKGGDICYITTTRKIADDDDKKCNYFELQDVDHGKAMIKSKLGDNKRVAIFAFERSLCDDLNGLLSKEFPAKKIGLYTGQTSNKRELMDVNKYWGKLDILIVNSVAGSGVDFNRRHFDVKFVFGPSNTRISLNSLNQLKERVRYVNDKEVYYHVKKSNPAKMCGRNPLTEAGVKKEFIRAIKGHNKIKSVVYNLMTMKLDVMKKRRHPFFDETNLWFGFSVQTQLEVNMFQCFGKRMFEDHVLKDGHELIRIKEKGNIPITPEQAKKLKLEQKAINEEKKKKMILLFDQASEDPIDIKISQFNIYNSVAEPIDYVTVNKAHNNELVKKSVKLTGEQHLNMNLQMEWIQNYLQEINSTVNIECIRDYDNRLRDTNADKLKVFLQFKAIMGLLDSISEKTLPLDLTDWFNEYSSALLPLVPSIRKTLRVTAGKMDNPENFLGLVNGTLRKWSGSKFKRDHVRKEDKIKSEKLGRRCKKRYTLLTLSPEMKEWQTYLTC